MLRYRHQFDVSKAHVEHVRNQPFDRLVLSLIHICKKLLFMGCEFGQESEFNVDAVFPWPHPYDERHRGVSALVRQLNAIYRSAPSLHRLDASPDGFTWLVANDDHASIFAFVRRSSDNDPGFIVVANMTPIPRHDYRVGAPRAGYWVETLNSDSSLFGGSNCLLYTSLPIVQGEDDVLA